MINICYRHKEWRTLAKKMRRKRIRRTLARKRDEVLDRGNVWQYTERVFSQMCDYNRADGGEGYRTTLKV